MQCPRGRLCDVEGTIVPKICPAGSYCPVGTSSQYTELPCPPGTYSDQEGIWEESQCRPCPAGKFCEIGTVTPQTCGEGHYCKNNAANDQFNDEFGNGPCPLGFYCEAGTVNPKPCPPGTYGAEIGLTNRGQKRCSDCPQGFFCPFWGMGSPIQIDTPSFSGNLILDSRFECENGFACEVGERTTKDPKEYLCPSGKYCDKKQSFSCQNGRYQSAAGQSECATCPAGHFCGADERDGISTYEECPQGSFCMDGTSSPAECPPGSYTNYTGAGGDGRDDYCFECPPTKFCENGEIKGDCDAGYICYQGSSTRRPGTGDVSSGEPCPRGFFCEEGAAGLNACPEGRFIQMDPYPGTDGAGARDDSDCEPCQPGQFCPTNAITVKDCNVGGYCEEGLHIPCPKGKYNDVTGAEDESACKPCQPGWYCPDENMSKFEQYPAYPGYYIDSEDQFNLTNGCPPGTFLPEAGIDDVSECRNCPAGYYCLDFDMESPLGCDEGSFCPGPEYCDVDEFDLCDQLWPEGRQYGNFNQTACPKDYFCEVTTNIEPCHAGYYCPEGSAFQTSCGDGLFCPEDGQCPVFGDEDLSQEGDGRSPCTCPNGYYEMAEADRKTLEATCDRCPPGTFNNANVRANLCQPCAPGVICYSPAVTDNATDPINNGNTVPCPDGYYCPEGSLEPLPCPVGTYYSRNNSLGTTLKETCFACPVDCDTFSSEFNEECDPDTFSGSFSNVIGSFECRPCGDDAEQSLPGQETCICKAKNRNFHATDLRSGFRLMCIKRVQINVYRNACTKTYKYVPYK